MSDELHGVVGALASALDKDAGISNEEPGHAVMIITASPEGKVETYTNMPTEAYRDLLRFMAQQTAIGAFDSEELPERTKQ